MKMDLRQQRSSMSAYFASVAYMDAQVGKVLQALKDAGIEDRTIVIFTSDHGYHLGEHDFWAKVSLREESIRVPLIISVPGHEPAICDSLCELLDLYPTTAELCGLDVPERLQGKSIASLLKDPELEVRDTAFSVNGKGFALRTDDWAYLQYGRDGKQGRELFNMQQDPLQYRNLAEDPEHADIVAQFERQLAEKLKAVEDNDLELE